MALPAQTSSLRRIIVGVALLGVLVVAHLALQKANGFANGCTGLGDVAFTPGAVGAGGTEAGCATVTEGEYATFAGVSNLVWGALFYLLVVGLRLAYAATADSRLRLASAGVVGVGLLYTVWLVYLQAVVIGSFCVLCMTSAALVLTLTVLHVLEHRRLQDAAPAPRRQPAVPTGAAALRPYVPLLGFFLVLLVADVGLASRAAEPESGPVAPLGQQAAALPSTAGECAFDPAIGPVEDLAPFTDGPFKGSADAPVRVVKVFDPNCPHCKDLSESLEPVIAEMGGQARFYYVPYPLQQTSLGQVVALKLAAREGRFFELVDEMFARQDQTWGMTLPEIVAAAEAVGMDGGALLATLQDEAGLRPLLDEIEAEAQAVQAAFAGPDGGMSVPKLVIEGNVVASTYASYSPRCLAQFVAEAQPAAGEE